MHINGILNIAAGKYLNTRKNNSPELGIIE